MNFFIIKMWKSEHAEYFMIIDREKHKQFLIKFQATWKGTLDNVLYLFPPS